MVAAVGEIAKDNQYQDIAGADLGFIKGGGLTQGTNLLGRGVQSTFQHHAGTRGSGGMPPRKILKNSRMLNYCNWRYFHIKFIIFSACRYFIYCL